MSASLGSNAARVGWVKRGLVFRHPAHVISRGSPRVMTMEPAKGQYNEQLSRKCLIFSNSEELRSSLAGTRWSPRFEASCSALAALLLRHGAGLARHYRIDVVLLLDTQLALRQSGQRFENDSTRVHDRRDARVQQRCHLHYF